MPNFVESTYPPYLQAIFLVFKIWFLNFNELFSFSLPWDPMGVKISKRYSSYSYNSFSTKLLYVFPVTVLTKLADRNFEISNLNF